MFSKSQDEPEKKSGAFAEIAGAPAPTIISVDMRVSGDMRTDGDVQVDGVVDGDIQSATISVGKTAEVNGEIVAEKIKVFGRVNGRIRGKEIVLMETAEVNGDIVHESLEINRGAFIDGIVKRSVNEDPKPVKVDLVVAPGGVKKDEPKAADDKSEKADASAAKIDVKEDDAAEAPEAENAKKASGNAAG